MRTETFVTKVTPTAGIFSPHRTTTMDSFSWVSVLRQLHLNLKLPCTAHSPWYRSVSRGTDFSIRISQPWKILISYYSSRCCWQAMTSISSLPRFITIGHQPLHQMTHKYWCQCCLDYAAFVKDTDHNIATYIIMAAPTNGKFIAWLVPRFLSTLYYINTLGAGEGGY